MDVGRRLRRGLTMTDEITDVVDSTAAIAVMKQYRIDYAFMSLEIDAYSYEQAFEWHNTNHPTWELEGITEVGDKFARR
jgi:hypothetical protein